MGFRNAHFGFVNDAAVIMENKQRSQDQNMSPCSSSMRVKHIIIALLIYIRMTEDHKFYSFIKDSLQNVFSEMHKKIIAFIEHIII